MVIMGKNRTIDSTYLQQSSSSYNSTITTKPNLTCIKQQQQQATTMNKNKNTSNNKNKKKNKSYSFFQNKRTPCSTLLELTEYYNSTIQTDPQTVFIALCTNPIGLIIDNNNNNTNNNIDYKKNSKRNHEEFFRTIERHLKWTPGMIHSIDGNNRNTTTNDSTTKGYNVMHHLLSNTTITNQDLKVFKLIIQTSNMIQEKEERKSLAKNKAKCSIVTTAKNHVNRLLAQRTFVHGLLPIHIACQNITQNTFDLLEYIIEQHPCSVQIQDSIQQNLPLHYACEACTKKRSTTTTTTTTTSSNIVPLEAIILLIQQYPESCSIQNRNGDVPLHLAVQLIVETSTSCNNSSQLQQHRYTKRTTTMTKRTKSSKDLLHDSTKEFFLEKDIDLLDDIYLDIRDDDDTNDKVLESSSSSLDDDDNWKHKSYNSIFSNGSSSSSLSSINYSNHKKYPLQSTYAMYCKEKEKELYEHYQTQLDIVQYLVDVYPQAMFITNKQGYTPLQLALSISSTKQFVFPTRHGQQNQQHFIHGSNNNHNVQNNNNNTTKESGILFNPIIEFLRNHPLKVTTTPIGSSSSTTKTTTLADPTTTTKTTGTTTTTQANELVQVPEMTSYPLGLDASGHVYDDHDDDNDIVVFDGIVAPWKQRQSNDPNCDPNPFSNGTTAIPYETAAATASLCQRTGTGSRRGSVGLGTSLHRRSSCIGSRRGSTSSRRYSTSSRRGSTSSRRGSVCGTIQSNDQSSCTGICPIEKVCHVLDDTTCSEEVNDVDTNSDQDENDFLLVRQRLQYTYINNDNHDNNQKTTRTFQKHRYEHEGLC